MLHFQYCLFTDHQCLFHDLSDLMVLECFFTCTIRDRTRWDGMKGCKASGGPRFLLRASKEVDKTHLPQFSEVSVGGPGEPGRYEKVMVNRWNNDVLSILKSWSDLPSDPKGLGSTPRKRCVYVITFSSLQHLCSCNDPNMYVICIYLYIYTHTCNVTNYPQNLCFFVPASFLKIPSRDELSSFEKCRSSRHGIRSHEPEGISKAPGVLCESIRFTKKNTKW